MDKIVEALKKALPAEAVPQITEAVENMIEEVRAELAAEFNKKLQEGYADLSAEMAAAEKIAEKGYGQAFGMITDLRNRLQQVRLEYDAHLETEFGKASKAIKEERQKYQTLKSELRAEYDEKLARMNEYIIDKLDEFVQYKGAEIYENAVRDVMNDPRMADRQVVLDKIIDAVGGYLGSEEHAMVANGKLEEAYNRIQELTGQIRMLEHRSLRIAQENKNLQESVRRKDKVITESTNGNKQERAQKAKNVTGRGRVQTEQVEVIREHQNDVPQNTDDTASLNESAVGADLAQLQILAGVKKQQ